jgi:DNA-binding winged helix-turn-helix (wHTH) protein
MRSILRLMIYLMILISWMVVPIMASDTSLVSPSEIKSELASDEINLALRRTADKLLRALGDSTSRIPAVEKVDDQTWRVFINQSFEYKLLPPILQSSLDQYGITQAYQVTVRECETDLIDLGYHKKDFIRDTIVPCGTRVAPEGCHYIEISFTGSPGIKSFWTGNNKFFFGLMGLLGIGGLFTWWQLKKKRSTIAVTPSNENGGESKWILFGRSSLHVTSPILDSGGMRHQLTFREAKLLRLFALHPSELLDRDQILQQVWEDEGVQVTRSVDVFVSRLRKKLSGDPTISIVAVHGVGYKLETELVSSQ